MPRTRGCRSQAVKRFGFLSPAQDIKAILEAGGISRLRQEHAFGIPVQWSVGHILKDPGGSLWDEPSALHPRLRR